MEGRIASPRPFAPLRWLLQRGRAVMAAAPAHLGIHAVAFGTYGGALLESWHLGDPLELDLTGMASAAVVVATLFLVSIRLFGSLVALWRSGYAGSPTAALLRELFVDILSPGRVANSLHAFIALGVFGVGFTTLKSNIPRLHPFTWDTALMEADRLLHFGYLPHELLAPLFAYPPVTFVFNLVYNGWYFVLLSFFLWQGFREEDTALRQRFLLAFLVCWLMGTGLLGTLLSSAGPCYYGRLVPGPDPYMGLMSYLDKANLSYPIWALSTQDMLWESYETSKGVVSGISAMPSMHVGSSLIFFLCARASGIHWLAWVTGGFTIAILLGSVLLAWHYAVDGYAGALVALASWWLAGQWVKRRGLSSRPS